jgi:hypothetical protein
MKNLLRTVLAAGLLAGLSAHAATVGQPAPAFTVTDTNGVTHNLADFKGKTVVLEWHNPKCPFVVKHYDPKNMQGQQKTATADGVLWISVNSGAPGKQGHMAPAEANALRTSQGAANTAYVIDAEGTVGKAYAAKTTPHMYVIDAEGVLRYNGAIDSISSGDQADIPKATQYVTQALAEIKAGKPVSVPTSQPYGCSVKYL